ncbi:hypothetical protein CJ014_05840 [Pleomorphomonas carboxyditropha]|uniref:PPM-type phosphatase domain-containing protein n=2 Tax=Pleomorphomonas carboxyditropha TaxID=2023338 RepID=A0A2G9X022_9HYPH|nr:hypothetical protein CJ014_05840 [Pleomorphomonas carboxyditropha]
MPEDRFMRIDCLSVSKYAAPGKAGDDIPVVIPGRCYAVFDGATDVNGASIAGVGSGRFAALQASAALIDALVEQAPGTRTPDELVAILNARLGAALDKESRARGERISAATTMALMEEVGDSLRFTLVGDSGIRINGEETFQSLKPIDDIMSAGRVALYHHLRRRGLAAAALEPDSRRGVFRGFDEAIPALISEDEAAEVIGEARRMLTGRLDDALLAFVEPMLRAGIARGQYGYANDADHPLGYAVIDGTVSRGFGLISFERPRRSVRCVEIFSDGYLELPEGTALADWEAVADRIEREDPTKTLTHWGVKGSGPEQLFDDRTVIILSD